MAYQTGIVADYHDVLDTLAAFAVAQGWTQDALGDVVAATERELMLNNGSIYVSLGAKTWSQYNRANTTVRTATKGVSMLGNTGYTGGNHWWEQPGRAAIEAQANDLSETNMAYWLFGDATYVHMVIRPVGGVYKQLGFGTLDQLGGSYTDGAYVFATYWDCYTTRIHLESVSDHKYLFDAGCGYDATEDERKHTHVRADLEGGSPEWRYMASIPSAGSFPAVAFGVYRDGNVADYLDAFGGRSPNALNGQVITHPIHVHALLANGNYQRLGVVPDLRFVWLDGVEPEQQLTLGSDNWVCFPVIQKNGATGTPNSGLYGLACRIVP